MGDTIKSYKGFNKDMTCRGFQYEIGKEYEEENAKACECGFHACEYPLDCFSYYAPSQSEFCEVEQSGKISKSDKDTKVSSSKIKIGAKLDIARLVKSAIEFTKSQAINENNAIENYDTSSATGNCRASSATGNYSASSATGYKGASSATGDYGASSATGNCGASSATGYQGASSATGNYGASSATGDYGASSATGGCGASLATGYQCASSATGDYGASSATGNHGASSATGDCGTSSATGYKGASTATGNYGASSATGDYGASSATGDCGASSATGYKGVSSAENPTAIAVAWGYKSRAKGVIGSYIVCAEWIENEQGEWDFIQAKMVQVDGEKIKADTYYELIDGEFVEDEN